MNRIAVSLAVLALIAFSAAGAYIVLHGNSCNPQRANVTTTPSLKATTFGAVTEYALPMPHDWANAVTLASDGSVWFGEQALPGMARFDPSSGQLTEYQWSCYPTSQSGGAVTSIWGVVQWNGMVWATDGDANRLVGLNPSDGSLTYVNTTSAKFPYLLSPSPDGSLWFTSLSTKPLLGRLTPDLRLTVYSVSGVGAQEPIQVLFVNSTFAYTVALDPLSSSGAGGLYSFDPQTAGTVIPASRVGGDFTLVDPDSLSLQGGRIWIAQHFPSNVVEYDSATGLWTVYPTSLLTYPGHPHSTLPYFVQAAGPSVWFNEHYGNRIALLNPGTGTLTEYSEADPPVTNASRIHDDLTIAAGPNGLWFTSTTADYLGFVSAGYSTGFSLATNGADTLSLAPGGATNAVFQLSGTWSALKVQVSDSENVMSVPSLISIQPERSLFPAGSGNTDFAVAISANVSIHPGRYTVAVTVTDGLVLQTAFIYLTVT